MEYKIQAYVTGNGESNKLLSFKVYDATKFNDPLYWMVNNGYYIKAAFVVYEVVDRNTGEIKKQSTRCPVELLQSINKKQDLSFNTLKKYR